MASDETERTPEKSFLRDRLVLLLLSVNAFLALLAILVVIFRLETGASSSGFIVQYRPSLGISAFKTGSQVALFSFALFAALVAAGHAVLSLRAYPIRRELSVIILALGSLLLIVAIIVSNALLALH